MVSIVFMILSAERVSLLGQSFSVIAQCLLYLMQAVSASCPTLWSGSESIVSDVCVAFEHGLELSTCARFADGPFVIQATLCPASNHHWSVTQARRWSPRVRWFDMWTCVDTRCLPKHIGSIPAVYVWFEKQIECPFELCGLFIFGWSGLVSAQRNLFSVCTWLQCELDQDHQKPTSLTQYSRHQ